MDQLLCLGNQLRTAVELTQLDEDVGVTEADAPRRSHVGGGVSVRARDEVGDGGAPPTFRHLAGGVEGLHSAADVAVALAEL